jgi:hypothetical protein
MVVVSRFWFFWPGFPPLDYRACKKLPSTILRRLIEKSIVQEQFDSATVIQVGFGSTKIKSSRSLNQKTIGPSYDGRGRQRTR